MRDSYMKQTKHTTRPMGGYNDVSRYTWSTVQPQGSELPHNQTRQLNEASRLSYKGTTDEQTWQMVRDSPADMIGGPKASFKVHGRRRDRQHTEIVQGMMNRQMLTLKNYNLKKAQ